MKADLEYLPYTNGNCIEVRRDYVTGKPLIEVDFYQAKFDSVNDFDSEKWEENLSTLEFKENTTKKMWRFIYSQARNCLREYRLTGNINGFPLFEPASHSQWEFLAKTYRGFYA